MLFGYRLQLFAEARARCVGGVSDGRVHRSTYYVWKRQVDRHGLEMLRPRERRRPLMPNQLPKMVKERILSFSIAHPGFGPRRISAELAREKWGGIVVSPDGVWKVLCRHGLDTRAKRLGLVAGYAAPYEPPRDRGPEQHIDVDRPGERVGIDCFYVGRLRGTAGAIWQLTAIDAASSYAWAELVICKQGNPPRARPASLPAASPRTLKPPDGNSSGCSQTTATSSRATSRPPSPASRNATPASTQAAHRPTGTSKHSTKRSSTNAGVPRRSLPLPHLHRPHARARYLPAFITTTTASTTAASSKDASQQTSFTAPTRWRPDEPRLSARLGVSPA